VIASQFIRESIDRVDQPSLLHSIHETARQPQTTAGCFFAPGDPGDSSSLHGAGHHNALRLNRRFTPRKARHSGAIPPDCHIHGIGTGIRSRFRTLNASIGMCRLFGLEVKSATHWRCSPSEDSNRACCELTNQAINTNCDLSDRCIPKSRKNLFPKKGFQIDFERFLRQ
jgi:hypothetical protein